MEVRFLDRVVVVGRSEPIAIYEIITTKGQLSEKEKGLIKIFDEGMRSYLNMDWDRAIAAFTEARRLERFPDFGVTPSDVFMERSLACKENPPVSPGEVWDGVYRAKKK
jgi:adenylate cyclase